MSATVTVPAGTDLGLFLESAGIDPLACSFTMSDAGILLSAPVTQEVLDAAVAAHAPVVRAPVRTLPPLDFLARFTDPEKAGIYTARRSVWQIDDFITQLAATPTLTLDDGTGHPDPRLKAGVDFLVSGGLLTSERAAAVLAP